MPYTQNPGALLLLLTPTQLWAELQPQGYKPWAETRSHAMETSWDSTVIRIPKQHCRASRGLNQRARNMVSTST
jgi:hypothetical protein